MKNNVLFLIILGLFLNNYLCLSQAVVENKNFRLVFNNHGEAISLVHKSSGQECLDTSKLVPAFSVTQYRPFQNEHFLIMPTKETTFYPDSIYREGDNLIVTFEKILYKVTIGLNITDNYIGFKLKTLEQRFGQLVDRDKEAESRVNEFTLLQLPVKKRKHFGGWLNVVLDDEVAVNLLATDKHCKIDAEEQDGYYLMKAGMEKNVKLFEVGAALITTYKDQLLDCIDRLEVDYDLPRGVKSRRDETYKYSYYEVYDINPQNVEEHIKYAKMGGFRAILIYYIAFADAMGHFPWRPEYPNGMEDLKLVTKKIIDAGIIPGFHIHYNKAMKHDKYVSPVPDPRLHLSRNFTLAEAVDAKSTTITVEENPEGSTMVEGRRILKLSNELIKYESYTKARPYQFKGCERGYLNSTVSNHNYGLRCGLLDVDDWDIFIRFDQNTSIQEEVAKKVAGIYKDAGFKFIYFDGAEDVHEPFWYTVGSSQYEVYKHFDPKPLFSEGAAKAHFSWHLVTRGNAFDVYPPEMVKMKVKTLMAYEADYIRHDFSSINFGWNSLTPPGEKTIGTQPDIYEYVCSRATAFNCPFSLIGFIDDFKAHPRTRDNLEVFKMWEDARLQDFFTEQQKEEMQNLEQEYMLIINEKKEFELHKSWQISGWPVNSSIIRAYGFERNGKIHVSYWNSNNSCKITLEMDAQKIKLLEEIGKPARFKTKNGRVILPADNRRFIETELSAGEIIDAFNSLEIVDF